ncbi:MAG: hypothetical protein E7016_00295 [Alphaproteobacteria bacterium]|nr:hypothetical protein [Alphaproteobacteria bacterium]
MRKYFLLSAVALMAATSANATTAYTSLEAEVKIEYAVKFDCEKMDFGTIVVNSMLGENGDDLITNGMPNPNMVVSSSKSDYTFYCTTDYQGDLNLVIDDVYISLIHTNDADGTSYPHFVVEPNFELQSDEFDSEGVVLVSTPTIRTEAIADYLAGTYVGSMQLVFVE